jgi:predicted RNA-binding protein with RPS1 domain
VKLDDDIHGLAHITQLGLGKQEKISDLFRANEEKEFEILSISPQEHRLALKLNKEGKKEKIGSGSQENKSEKESKSKADESEKIAAGVVAETEVKVEAAGEEKKAAKPKAVKKAKK